MAFLNSLIFPSAIAFEAEGGPKWSTQITVNDAGYEFRNQPWTYPLHEYQVGWIKTAEDVETLLSIYYAAKGMLHGFRFLDRLDYKSCSVTASPAYTDQTILASATGGEDEVQLVKNYTYAGTSLERKITRPYGTVYLGINGTQKTEGTHYTVDKTTGLVDLTGGTSPHGALSATDAVTAGYTFHVPVRFGTNNLPFKRYGKDIGSAEVPLVEVRE